MALRNFCSDRSFMMEVCRECTEAFALVELVLMRDRSFLELTLEKNVDVLQFLSRDTQQLHEDLVIKAIPNLSQEKGEMVSYFIAKAISPLFLEAAPLHHDLVESWSSCPQSCAFSKMHWKLGGTNENFVLQVLYEETSKMFRFGT